MLLLQLQFWNIQAALGKRENSRARPDPCSFDRVWQVTQVQFQQAQLVLAGIGGTRVVVCCSFSLDRSRLLCQG